MIFSKSLKIIAFGLFLLFNMCTATSGTDYAIRMFRLKQILKNPVLAAEYRRRMAIATRQRDERAQLLRRKFGKYFEPSKKLIAKQNSRMNRFMQFHG